MIMFYTKHDAISYLSSSLDQNLDVNYHNLCRRGRKKKLVFVFTHLKYVRVAPDISFLCFTICVSQFMFFPRFIISSVQCNKLNVFCS